MEVQPGDVFENLDAMPGWTCIRILKIGPVLVEVGFLKPKSYWMEGVTGLLKKERLKHYHKKVKASEVDFVIEALYLNSIDGVLVRGQRKGSKK